MIAYPLLVVHTAFSTIFCSSFCGFFRYCVVCTTAVS
nr:MAG TPA: hypothetical protein [Caudoviricetes sp.]